MTDRLSPDERRKMRRKKIRRKRILRALIILLVSAVITLGILCLTVFFPIRKIVVTGSTRYSSERIIKESKLMDKNLFCFSSADLETNLRKKMPYIDKITVKRNLPDTVSVKVKDAEEFAAYHTADGFAILSERNYVLSKVSELPENLFEVKCTSQPKCTVGQQAIFENEKEKELIDRIVKNILSHKLSVNCVDTTNVIALTVTVNGKYKVNLGDSADLEGKIEHLAGMVKNIGDDRTGLINLSMWTSKNTQGTFKQGAVE